MTKCFFCSNDAVIEGYTYSPASDSGMIPVRPYCADCAIRVQPELVKKLVDHGTFCIAFRDAYNKIGEKSQYDNYKPKEKEGSALDSSKKEEKE